MNERRTTETYTLSIYMAGDIATAKQVCREFCRIGFCVTTEPLTFIYSGGEEKGFRIGVINYPRFPSSPDTLWEQTTLLANTLRSRLCQHSYSIVSPDKTVWDSCRA